MLLKISVHTNTTCRAGPNKCHKLDQPPGNFFQHRDWFGINKLLCCDLLYVLSPFPGYGKIPGLCIQFSGLFDDLLITNFPPSRGSFGNPGVGISLEEMVLSTLE